MTYVIVLRRFYKKKLFKTVLFAITKKNEDYSTPVTFSVTSS